MSSTSPEELIWSEFQTFLGAKFERVTVERYRSTFMKYLNWSKKFRENETTHELQKILEQYSTEFEEFFRENDVDVIKEQKWKLYQQVQLKLGWDAKYDYDYENKILKVSCDQCIYIGKAGTDLYYHKR